MQLLTAIIGGKRLILVRFCVELSLYLLRTIGIIFNLVFIFFVRKSRILNWPVAVNWCDVNGHYDVR